jgi:hypothetical protein
MLIMIVGAGADADAVATGGETVWLVTSGGGRLLIQKLTYRHAIVARFAARGRGCRVRLLNVKGFRGVATVAAAFIASVVPAHKVLTAAVAAKWGADVAATMFSHP